MNRLKTALLLLALAAAACTPAPKELPKAMVVSVTVDGKPAITSAAGDVTAESPAIELEFTRDVTPGAGIGEVYFTGGELSASGGSSASKVVLTPTARLQDFKRYVLTLPAGDHFGVNLVEDLSVVFTTSYDPSPKFPQITDDELLTLVQRQTFKYFWDYAHPACGLTRERLGSDETVTTGGSGFGIMTMPVAVERGFVTRTEAADRLRTITGFLLNKADRFHGAFPHWIHGTTGAIQPFSTNDNGGDLVETAFLVQGLLTAAVYFDRPEEADIREAIDAIWRGVEWDWYTRGGQDVLYWHWSPDREWAMNMQINGWNEALIVYVLAASSPTHPVGPSVYHEGWARNGGIASSSADRP